jgi:hypothetical protein
MSEENSKKRNVNYEKKLAKSKDKIKRLSKQLEEKDNRISYFRHEIMNVIGASESIFNALKENYGSYSEEEIKEIIDVQLKISKKMDKLSGFLFSKETGKKEIFSLEKLAIDYSEIYDVEKMKHEKIGLNLRYDKQDNKSLEIYAHLTDFEALWGTLLVNSLSWTPKFSKIEQAFRINKNCCLEILFENKKSEEKLRELGMGRGIGTKILRQIVNEYGGEFHNYSKSQIIPNIKRKEYDKMITFGHPEAVNVINKNETIFGTRIMIPLDKLKE